MLTYLHRKADHSGPSPADDLVGLQFLEQVWCDRELLRAQLRRFSLKARTSLIRTANLTTKWERYAYSRFRNQEEGSNLPMRQGNRGDRDHLPFQAQQTAHQATASEFVTGHRSQDIEKQNLRIRSRGIPLTERKLKKKKQRLLAPYRMKKIPIFQKEKSRKHVTPPEMNK